MLFCLYIIDRVKKMRYMYMTFLVLFLVFSCICLLFRKILLSLQRSNVSSYPPSRFARHTRKETDTLLLFFVFLEIICEKVV